MKVLITAATWPEIAPLANHFNLKEKSFLSTPDFDLLITGVGMTATAFALGQHLFNRYDLAINLGIAGSFTRKWELGTVLNIVKDEFSELGAQDGEHFHSIESLGFGKSTFCASAELAHQRIAILPEANAITVNQVHGQEEAISRILERLKPDTESMEGAAFFYCCEQTATPSLQIRAISNYVEKRNREAWRIGPAIKNLNDWAIGFLTNA